MNLICFMIWEKMTAFVFVWGGQPWSCLSTSAEFSDGRETSPKAFVCEANYLQIKEFANQAITP